MSKSVSPRRASPLSPVAPSDVNVIARALDILEIFETSSGPVPMMFVVQQTGLHKATVFRLLTTLVHDGVLNQTLSGEYELGFFATGRANIVLQSDPLWRAARPVMERLCKELNESLVLTRRFGDDCIDLDLVSALTPVVQTPAIGRRRPLHESVAGRVILASEPGADVQAYVDRATESGSCKAAITAWLTEPSSSVAEVIRGADARPIAAVWLAIPPGRPVDLRAWSEALSRGCQEITLTYQA